MIKEIVKGMWQFARFLFVPQWGRNKGNEFMLRQAAKPSGWVRDEDPAENRRERWLRNSEMESRGKGRNRDSRWGHRAQDKEAKLSRYRSMLTIYIIMNKKDGNRTKGATH